VSRLAHTFYAVAWIIVILRLLLNLSLLFVVAIAGRNVADVVQLQRIRITFTFLFDIISSVSFLALLFVLRHSYRGAQQKSEEDTDDMMSRER